MQNTTQDSRPLGGYSVLLDIPSSRNFWPSFLALVLAVLTSRAFYNVYFHPLAKFRGPRLAALSTYWIYFYGRDGKIEKKLELLHKKYRELSSQLHTKSNPRLKYHMQRHMHCVYPHQSSTLQILSSITKSTAKIPFL